MSTCSQKWRWRAARSGYLYSALIAGWLLSLLTPWSTMDVVEWAHFAVLTIVVPASMLLVFTLSSARSLVRTCARILWGLGVVMFIRTAWRVAATDWAEAGPALVFSHALIFSLWISVAASSTLVLWPRKTRSIPAASGG